MTRFCTWTLCLTVTATAPMAVHASIWGGDLLGGAGNFETGNLSQWDSPDPMPTYYSVETRDSYGAAPNPGLPENYVPAPMRVGGMVTDSIAGRAVAQGRGAAPSRRGGMPSDPRRLAAKRAGG